MVRGRKEVRGGEEEDEEVRGTEGDGDRAGNGEEGDEEVKGGEGGGEQREEEDGGKEGHGGDGEDADAEGVRETDVVME